MRIIYAWNYAEWGGAQIHFLGLIKEARKTFDVHVVLPASTSRYFLQLLDNEAIGYTQFAPAASVTRSHGIAGKLRQHLVKIKSEYQMLRCLERLGLHGTIVHTDLLPTQSLLSLIWLCARTQVFVTSHNALPRVQKWRQSLWQTKFKIISMFDSYHVFCTNEHAADYFRSLYSGRVANEMRITYESVDVEAVNQALDSRFDRSAERRQLGFPASAFTVLAVGRFIDRKGRWVFLEAAKRIITTDSSVSFIWLTPSLPDETEIARIVEYGLGKKFQLVLSENIGRDRESILRFFRLADIFALPSFVEGLPIALLEAMALGIPSISTNIYGIPEAVIDEETGLLIAPGDAEALADAILRLKNDEELRQRLSVNGRKRVIEHFDERIAAHSAVAAYLAAAQ